jgi:hypothetical protein
VSQYYLLKFGQEGHVLMSTNKTILRNRHGAEVAAIFFVVGASFPRASQLSSVILRPRKKRSMHGTPISTQRRANFAKNEILVQRTSRLGSNEAA